MAEVPATLLGRLIRERHLSRQETLDQLHRLAITIGEPAFALAMRTLDRWLAGGLITLPRPVICRVLEAQFGCPVTTLLGPADHLAAVTGAQLPSPPIGTHLWPAPARPSTAEFLDATAQLRLMADGVLTLGSVTPSRLEVLEETVADLRHSHTIDPPMVMLQALMPELAAVLGFIDQPQTAYVRLGLSRCAAQLAILCADSMMKLGLTRDSHAWFRTARLAADDSGDLWLRAQARAQAAMLPYYYGDLPRTLRLAQEAQAIAGTTANPATCLAAAAEARAAARLGDRSTAEAAIARAQQLFDSAAQPQHPDAFAFPEQRLLFYLSGALTYLGEAERAAGVQAQALRLYRDRQAFTLDPTLIYLDQATGMIATDAVSACELTCATLERVPHGHLTQIVLTRGGDIVNALPTSVHDAPAARRLRELLDAGLQVELRAGP